MPVGTKVERRTLRTGRTRRDVIPSSNVVHRKTTKIETQITTTRNVSLHTPSGLPGRVLEQVEISVDRQKEKQGTLRRGERQGDEHQETRQIELMGVKRESRVQQAKKTVEAQHHVVTRLRDISIRHEFYTQKENPKPLTKTLQKDDGFGDDMQHPEKLKEKQEISEIRGRRRRVTESHATRLNKLTSCKEKETLDYFKLERTISSSVEPEHEGKRLTSMNHEVEQKHLLTTKTPPQGARMKTIPEGTEIRGRRRRLSPRPIPRTPKTAIASRQGSQWKQKDYIRLEKIISDLYDSKCALRKDDISSKAQFIRDVVEKDIITKIHELDKRFVFDILRSGSYYEKLKVRKPNEFDIMVCLKGNNIERCFEVQVCPIRRHTPHLSGFSYLQYQRHKDTNKDWEDFLVSSPTGVGCVLSSEKIVSHFRKLISRRCKKVPQFHKEPIIQGPAVNVEFMYEQDMIDVDIVLCIEVPQWPSNARRWGAQYSKWPSRKMIDDIKSKGCHVVPKAVGEDQRYWRLSFSLAEKSLLSPQGIDEDKKCYRIIKHIFEVNKRSLQPLCSYYLKTLFLHLRVTQFFTQHKFLILINFLKALVSKVKEKKLPHFFIPDVNLFSNFTDRDAVQIVSSLQRILANFSDPDSAIIFLKKLINPSNPLAKSNMGSKFS